MEENLQKAGELTLERSRAMICKCHVKEVYAEVHLQEKETIG